MSARKGIKLKLAISLLVVFIMLSTTAINWTLSAQALKKKLTQLHLENNFQYATKVAINTNDLLHNIQQNMNTLAKMVGEQRIDQSVLDHWRNANTNYYNSLFTTDSNGVVQIISPPIDDNSQSKVRPGTKLETDLAKQNLKNKKPFISNPYMAQSGNLMILISSPMFDTNNQYQGTVNGTIYLKDQNTLQNTLNQHEFLYGSSVFVVDQTGTIVFHPDTERINESIAEHPLIQQVLQGKSSADQIINRLGEEYFSGYAYMEHTGWGVITQTPTSVIDEPLRNLTNQIIVQSVPILVIILVLAWLVTKHVTKPINSLAKFSQEAVLSQKSAQSIQQIDVHTYIYEIRQLCQHILRHFHLLNTQAQKDGLTGLANRRVFDYDIQALVEQKIPFTLIMIDIDRFKSVNDLHGHLVGDDVIRFIATTMREVSRERDNCYRYGGEEFAILLANQDVDAAFALAERLRTKIANTPSPTGYVVTISLGITALHEEDQRPEDIIQRADNALYLSKKNGRNQSAIM